MAQYNWLFFGNFDLALISLYIFWIFFAGLVWWIQRENMREGYPLENEDGSPAASLMAPPPPKTYIMRDGKGEYQAPNGRPDPRGPVALARTTESGGFPFEPTGDPMKDGVGPAAWCAREDDCERDSEGHPAMRPMGTSGDFWVSAGRDPRGLKVVANDLKSPGTVTDIWLDSADQQVRYLELTLNDGSKRLFPMQMVKIKADRIEVRALDSERFVDIPTIKSDTMVTKLEEDKICAFVAGGTMYAQDKKPSKMKALGGLF